MAKHKFLKSIFIFGLIISGFSMRAANLDSLLASTVSLQRPYILVDLPSSDCITCRAELCEIIKEIGSKIDPKHLAILSDEPQMNIYFNKYKNIFQNYKIFIDKGLAFSLTDDYRSKLYTVTASGVKMYRINSLNDKMVEEIVSAVNNVPPDEQAMYHFSDSIFQKDNNVFTANDSVSVLLSQRYQIGNIIDVGTKHNDYEEPQIGSGTIRRLQDIITTFHPDNLKPADSLTKMLYDLTLPTVYFYNMRIKEKYCYTMFYLNTVTEADVVIRGKEGKEDTKKRNIAVRGRNFIGRCSVNGEKDNVYSIDKYSAFSLIDSMHYNGKIYLPYLYKGFEVAGNSFYLPIRLLEDSASFTENKKLLIASFKFSDDGKLALERIYDFNGIPRPADFFFRIDEQGNPIIVDKMNKTFILYGKSEPVPFSQFKNDASELEQVYDLSLIDKAMYITGLCYNTPFCGKIDFKTATMVGSARKSGGIPYDMVFSGRKVYSYGKSDNEVKINSFDVAGTN